MGADIYLESEYKANERKHRRNFYRWCKKRDNAADDTRKKVCQNKVEYYHAMMYSRGYFRDSYNDSNFLNRVGLSWWQDVVPKLDKEGKLPVNQMEWLKKELVSRKFKPVSATEAKAWNEQVSEINLYFERKQKDLLNLLDTAIRKGEPLYCSL